MISDPTTRNFATLAIRPTWTSLSGIWIASLTLPEGFYFVAAQSQNCSRRSEQWVVVPGAVRHLAITLNLSGSPNTIAVLDENMYANAVYGTLPYPGARVEIMSADDIVGEQTRRSGTIDGNVYQITHLRHGHYVLRLVFGKTVVTHDVTIPATSWASATRIDFTAADALAIVQQEATGGRFVDVRTTSEQPGQTYKDGKATTHGWTNDPLEKPADYLPDFQRISPTATAALSSAAAFLQSDPRVPPAFRSLGAWTVSLFASGTPGYTVVRLEPVNVALWNANPPKADGTCVYLVADHFLALPVNNQTLKVEEPRFCP